MSELLDLVGNYMSRDRVETMSKSIGATPQQTQSAISALLPTLIAGMAKNASDQSGQEKLHNALQKDHDGSILDHLGTLFGNKPKEAPVSERTAAGGSILDHILGNRRGRVEQGVSQSSGLSSEQVMKLMIMVAPMLMGILGRKSKEQELSPGGLGSLLQGERGQVEAATGSTSFVGRLFDQDDDGDFDLADVMKFGAGKLFGR